jgi:hypothetical protein
MKRITNREFKFWLFGVATIPAAVLLAYLGIWIGMGAASIWTWVSQHEIVEKGTSYATLPANTQAAIAQVERDENGYPAAWSIPGAIFSKLNVPGYFLYKVYVKNCEQKEILLNSSEFLSDVMDYYKKYVSDPDYDGTARQWKAVAYRVYYNGIAVREIKGDK